MSFGANLLSISYQVVSLLLLTYFFEWYYILYFSTKGTANSSHLKVKGFQLIFLKCFSDVIKSCCKNF